MPLIVVIILLAVLVPQNFALADVLPCPASITNCLAGFNSFILEFLGNAIGWAAGLLNSFIQYQTNNAVFGVPVVDQSWTIIRNFVNLFFILVLIIMAFGTILDIKSYTWREMLAPFLIAALLINFSLAIGQYIITISNGLANVFLKQIGDPSVAFAKGADIAKLVTGGETSIISGASQVVVTGIFALIFLAIAFLAIFSALIFSIARLFVLWFLLIISPIAWFGYAMPNLRQKTWSDWWKNFWCWCFFLPYYIFFLMFAVIFINAKGTFLPLAGGNFPGIKMVGNDFMFYGISLIFLVGGLGVARKLACASGTGVAMVFGKIETGVRKYAPGAAYVRGGVAGLKERGAEIQEKGLFSIGGAQRARLQEATAKGWVAGVPGPGQVPGAREARERVEMVEIEKDAKRIREILVTKSANDQKKFLEDEKAKKGIAGQAAELEFVKQGYSKREDYQEAVKRYGGENSAFMRQYLENIKQAKLSDLFKGPEDELRIARGQVEGTDGLVNLRRELYKDLAKRNQISDVAVYKEAKQLLSPIPAELKSFLESIKPEYIVGTREARQDAIRTRALGDSELERKLVEFMKDKKELNDAQLRQNALDIVKTDTTAGKDTIEGRNIINEINKFNPIINIEAEFRSNNTIPMDQPLPDEANRRIMEEISTKIGDKEFSELRKMSGEFWKDTRTQQAVRETFDAEELTSLLENAPKEMRRALKSLSTPVQPTAPQRILTPPTSDSYQLRSKDEQAAREQILRDLGKI